MVKPAIHYLLKINNFSKTVMPYATIHIIIVNNKHSSILAIHSLNIHISNLHDINTCTYEKM